MKAYSRQLCSTKITDGDGQVVVRDFTCGLLSQPASPCLLPPKNIKQLLQLILPFPFFVIFHSFQCG